MCDYRDLLRMANSRDGVRNLRSNYTVNWYLINWYLVNWYLVNWYLVNRYQVYWYLVNWYLVNRYQVYWYLIDWYLVNWYLVNWYLVNRYQVYCGAGLTAASLQNPMCPTPTDSDSEQGSLEDFLEQCLAPCCWEIWKT
ncbi:conserved hypothetical protein [Culex quinquefasciatus]|uniref:Uncharacterized protein n=1 Tax=Culex quinquefasciatus TaxID=7176 RepID=B0WMY3_CULQU|nr:conserved hypothetical protein [Culex quinquefasciatus]|eukprot:XP_001850067.1 conserved hypothetical protein [Culex quinquefasciatus]